MSEIFNRLHKDLHYFFKENWVTRSSEWTGIDGLKWKSFRNDFIKKEVIPAIYEFLNIDKKEYVVTFSSGNGNNARAPWFGIKRRKTNANGENSYYMALIYSAENDAVLLNVTTSSNFLSNVMKLKPETISRVNQLLHAEIENDINISFENINEINKPIVPYEKPDYLANLYLDSSVFYSYVKFDETQWENIKKYVSSLFRIWVKSLPIVIPKEFFNSHKTLREIASNSKITFKTSDYIDTDKNNDEYLTLQRKTVIKNNVDPTKRKTKKIERNKYKLQREAQEATGFLGELAVEDFEKKRLIAAGREDLANKVKIMTTDGDGYDVLSYQINGLEKFIEVKSSSINSKHFYISANELDKALAKETEVYFVEKPGTSDVKIYQIDMSDDELCYTPTSFVVKIQ